MRVWKVKGAFLRPKETKRYSKCLKSNKRSITDVLRVNSHLLVRTPEAKDRKDSGTLSLVNQNLSVGTRKVCPDGLVIQSSVINTKPQHSNHFGRNQNRRGQ